MDRRQSIESLLKQTAADLAGIREGYEACSGTESLPEDVKIRIYDFLNHSRSVLDYLAQEIADVYKVRPKRKNWEPSFPIAWIKMKLPAFEKKLRETFVGLDAVAPRLFHYLIDIQHFDGDPWLSEFSLLVNFNKHEDLSPQPLGDFVSLIIHYKGCVIHFGALGIIGKPTASAGFRTKVLTLGNDSIVRMIGHDGTVQCIRGPDTIDVNTILLKDADAGIELVRRKWSDFKFHVSEHTAYGLLKIIDRNIRCVYQDILKMIDTAREA